MSNCCRQSNFTTFSIKFLAGFLTFGPAVSRSMTAGKSGSQSVLLAGYPCLSLFNDARLNGQVKAVLRPLIGPFC